MDFLGCNHESKKLTIGYSLKEFGEIYLQLVFLHDVKYRLQILEVIIFVSTFGGNIIPIAPL